MELKIGDPSKPSWQRLNVIGRQPGFHTMAGNQDDGDEQFEDFDLWLGLAGSCTVRMLGKSLELRAGRIILIPAGIRARQLTAADGELLMMWTHFDCMVDGQVINDARQYVDADNLQLTLPGIPTLALMAEVDSTGISEQLYRIRNRPPDDLGQLMLQITLMQIIRHLRETHLGLAGSVVDQRLEAAATFLEQNMERPITLSQVAKHVHVSPETLGRLFNANYRISPIAYLARLRMARARELLQDRRYNISEIASSCGFASIQYFSRTFSQEYGIPPSTFRQSLPLIP